MFCSSCGTNVATGDVFCCQCGCRLRTESTLTGKFSARDEYLIEVTVPFSYLFSVFNANVMCESNCYSYKTNRTLLFMLLLNVPIFCCRSAKCIHNWWSEASELWWIPGLSETQRKRPTESLRQGVTQDKEDTVCVGMCHCLHYIYDWNSESN